MTRPHVALRRRRLDAARLLAWALLLAGWVGLGSLAMALTRGPLAGFATIALWLLALGAFSAAIVRRAVDGAGLRVLLAVAALGAAWGTFASVHGGGAPALLAAVLGWAMVVTLASATVRSCRLALAERPAPSLAPAAAGAVLAWWPCSHAGAREPAAVPACSIVRCRPGPPAPGVTRRERRC